MDEATYTLQELAELSGIEARTIRSYIERDLLPGPYGLGPKAAYGQEHVDRLKVLALLRNAHRAITLDQIRSLLGQLTPEQISAIAEGRQKLSTAFGGALPATSALSYLKSITPRQFVSAASAPAPQAAPASPAPSPRQRPLSDLTSGPASAPRSPAGALRTAVSGRTRFEELHDVLDDALAGESVARAVRGETWQRIPITPDIELSVRGELDADQLAVVQRIGDHLRHLLMKGTRK